MWKIKLSGRNDSLETIGNYSTFTSLNKVLSFEMNAEEEEYAPVEVNFVSKRDDEKKNFYIETSKMIDRSITVTYFNPGIGSSGLTEPLIILENDIYYFKVMFNTNMVNNSETYRLSIEFFVQKK